MQANLHPEIQSLKQQYPVEQDERFLNAKAQTASTAPASDHAWLLVILVLAIFAVGLYRFNEQRNEQPDRSIEAVVADQAAGERVVDVVTSDPILTEGGNRTRSWPKDLGTPQPVPVSGQNERLVRRFYEEVLNQRQWVASDELFAEEVAYGRSGLAMTTSSLAALKQTLIVDSTSYACLSFAIEQIIIEDDWVRVDWTAGGTPLTSFSDHPPTGEPQVWSGYTVWQVASGKGYTVRQVASGKIVRMWNYNAPPSPPDWAGEDQAGLPGKLQNSLELAEYQLHRSGSYPLL